MGPSPSHENKGLESDSSPLPDSSNTSLNQTSDSALQNEFKTQAQLNDVVTS